jgi:hypothetical protein
MLNSRSVSRFSLIAIWAIVLSSLAAAQSAPSRETVIPSTDGVIEGEPTVRVDVTSTGATRHQLDSREAAQNRLEIKVVDGRYFWASRENRPLTVSPAGEYVYLSSAEPGQYIRFRKIDNRLSYVEHLDVGSGSVTYWGELRVVLGK